MRDNVPQPSRPGSAPGSYEEGNNASHRRRRQEQGRNGHCRSPYADLLVLAGHQHGSVGGLGAILGLECSGEVESLMQDVTDFAIGDRVMCSARHAMAEYAVTDAGRATKIPAGMTFEEVLLLCRDIGRTTPDFQRASSSVDCISNTRPKPHSA
jgi:Alcohol dehydrogenase GroES-like domain